VYIVIGNEGFVALRESGVFTSFAVHAVDPAVPTVVTALGGRATDENDHVLVPVALVRTLADSVVDEEWEAGFTKMCAYAESQGWTADEGSLIKAHIESYQQ
jgi:hypothetical protein